MWVFYLHVYMCTIYVPGRHGGLKSSGVGVTNGYEPLGGCWELIWVLGRSANTLNH